jgi:hypothetical protein
MSISFGAGLPAKGEIFGMEGAFTPLDMDSPAGFGPHIRRRRDCSKISLTARHSKRSGLFDLADQVDPLHPLDGSASAPDGLHTIILTPA